MACNIRNIEIKLKPNCTLLRWPSVIALIIYDEIIELVADSGFDVDVCNCDDGGSY